MKLLSSLFLLILVILSVGCNPKIQNARTFPPDKDTVRYVPYRKGDAWFFVDRQTPGEYASCARAFNNETYEDLRPFNKWGLALAKKNGKTGGINRKGEVIIPFVYKGLNHSFNNSFIILSDDMNHEVLLDSNGKIIYQCNDSTTVFFAISDVFTVENKISKTYGVMDSTGAWRIPPHKYYYSGIASVFSDTLTILNYSVKDKNGNKKWGLADKFGNEITKPLFTWVGVVSDTDPLVAVSTKDPYGDIIKYYNWETKKIQIDTEYNGGHEFVNGYAVVTKRIEGGYKRDGVIDTKGNVVIPFENEYMAKYFNGNYILAERKGKWGIVKKGGEVTVPFEYDHGEWLVSKHDLFFMKKDGKCGALDGEGNIIIPFDYDLDSSDKSSVKNITPHLIKVMKGGKCGIVNREHETLLPIEYPEFARSYYKPIVGGLIEAANVEERKIIGFIDLKFNTYWED